MFKSKKKREKKKCALDLCVHDGETEIGRKKEIERERERESERQRQSERAALSISNLETKKGIKIIDIHKIV